MKTILIGLILSVSIASGYYFYNDMCRSDSECSCRDSSPGDVTCMEPKQLGSWCRLQTNAMDLQQCREQL